MSHSNSRVRVILGASLLLGANAASSAAAPDDESGVLEEVVVTAQFREQSLQDTPIAITAVTGEMLEARGQDSLLDVAGQAPNVTLTRSTAFGGPSLIAFIRGIGQTDFNPALEAGVGIYVDDVYYSTLTGSVLDLLDLERVEVLRGPQGTLAGKNSIGGAIKLYSQKPSDEPGGYIEAGGGSFEAIDLRAAANFPLIDNKLYARVSGVSRSREGHVKTLDYGCSHPGSGFASQTHGANCVTGTEGGINYVALRAAFRWLPVDHVEVNLAADIIDDESEPSANTLLRTGPTVAPVVLSPGRGLVASAPAPLIWENFAIPGMTTGTVGCRFIAYGPNSCDPLSPNDPYVNYATYTDPRTGYALDRRQYFEGHGLSLDIAWDLSDSMNLRSISSYRSYDSAFASEQDGTPFPLTNIWQRQINDQFTQELRLSAKIGESTDLTFGAFYLESATDWSGRVDLGYVGFDFAFNPDQIDSTSKALFANGIFEITDWFEIAAGVRWSDDEKTYRYVRYNPDFSSILPCLGPPGTPGNPPNCLISSLDGTVGSFAGDRFDYRVALTFRLSDDVNVYGSYSTGYKGGGVNPRPFYNVQAVSFAPEELTAYEAGVKSEWLGGRLRLNAALFFNDYADAQATFTNCTALFGPVFGVPCLLNSNAGNAEVSGAELEASFRPIAALQVDASYSVLDFEYQSINPSTGIALDSITPYTPKSSWSAGAQYSIPFGNSTLTPRVDVTRQGDLYTSPTNTADSRIPSRRLVNARLAWESGDGDWTLALEGRNLTDELYYTASTEGISGGTGTVAASPGLPRTWSISLRHEF